MAQNKIKLLKNNEEKNWSHLEWVDEFYRFLQGELPDVIGMKSSKPKLTKKQAYNVIWYLQEHCPVIPDQIEQCDTCGELYDSYSQGYYSELTGKYYCCEGCEPSGLYEREQRWEKRKDAPFQRWLKKVKREQKNYPFLKDKEISETTLRRYFSDGKTPIETLNDIITIV